jgi:hypothetical protein
MDANSLFCMLLYLRLVLFNIGAFY